MSRLAPPFAPAAVAFDLDGLLVDSEDAWGRAERRLVIEFGGAWDEAVRDLLHGRGPDDAARTLAGWLGEAHDPVTVGRALQAAAAAEFRRGLEPRPGARELVTAVRRVLPVAVATNSRRNLAEIALESAGLAGDVDALVTVDDVAAPKPAADVYLGAAAAVGAEPGRCVAFEDSEVGVVAARAAGMWVIACPSLPGADLSAADAVIDSLTNVDPVALLAQAA